MVAEFHFQRDDISTMQCCQCWYFRHNYCWPNYRFPSVNDETKDFLFVHFTSGVFWFKTNSVHDWLFQIVDTTSASDWPIVFKRFPLLSLKNSFLFAFPSKRLLSFSLFPQKDFFLSTERKDFCAVSTFTSLVKSFKPCLLQYYLRLF